MFVPKRIKENREKANLSQERLVIELYGVGLRISRQTLVSWETGKTIPDARALAILSRFFGVPVGSFFNIKPYLSGKGIR